MKYIIIGLFTILIFNQISAQELNKTENHFTSSDGKFFFNRNAPCFFYVSTSPSESAPKYLLKSSTEPKYSNPMYFDLEGYNSLRYSYSVDTIKKTAVYPSQQVRFEIYADGTSPKTTASFMNAPKYVVQNKTFYGKGLEIELKSYDEQSGVAGIFYSINGGAFVKYTEPIEFQKEQDNINVKFYAIDNVGNIEKINDFTFTLDLTAPSVTKNIDGKFTGNVLSRDATISISAIDNLSGVSKIYYMINDREPKPYIQPLSAMIFLGGNNTLKFYAIDNVKNNSLGNTKDDANSDFNYGFIVDDSGPMSELEIIGDQYKGKQLYVSSRSQFKINSKDAFSEIKEVKFGINEPANTLYNDNPQNFATKSGQQIINYYAQDVVGNIGNKSTTVIYLDNSEPVTYINIGKPQFFHRDTLFINKNTPIKLISSDNESGLAKIEYSIDESTFSIYSQEFKFDKEGFHKIKFKATDNVNNVENIKESFVVVDNTAPEIFIKFSIEPIRLETKNGKSLPVYPPYVKMYLAATDRSTGEQEIYYSINGSKMNRYISADNIESAGLLSKEKQYSVSVKAVDKLGNEGEKTVEFIIAKK